MVKVKRQRRSILSIILSAFTATLLISCSDSTDKKNHNPKVIPTVKVIGSKKIESKYFQVQGHVRKVKSNS